MNQLRLFSQREIYACPIENGRILGPLADGAPVIVSNGMGSDSMAMLVESSRIGLTPDAIVTALVGRSWFGNENRATYSYLPVQQHWLAGVGFPPIQFVWYKLGRKAKHYEYLSLAGNCLANRTLPSISFRRTHSCSVKWKGDVIDRWVTNQYGDQPCYWLVGYDCTEGHRNTRFSNIKPRSKARAGDVFLYPLQQWGFTRESCLDAIDSAGLPQPGKSSCFFCASMKSYELDSLYPDELWVIVIIEANAQPNLRSIKGLFGHNGRMTDYIVSRGLLPPELVGEVWGKWSAVLRPPELRDNPDAVADQILFAEANRLAAMTGFIRLPDIFPI